MPMRILVINGPNLNMLGKRETKRYGETILEAIEQALTERGKKLSCELAFFQSNHEGALIDFIQKEAAQADGIVINPGALTHYGYSLHDALVDSELPVVEVHLTNIYAREDWRQRSVTTAAAIGQITGFKAQSYYLGLEALVNHIRGKIDK
jgi:3-dehydroquinate dehydratase-2